MYKAIVTPLRAVRKHPNADRLDLATVCGNQVVIGKNHKDGDLGVYFDVDGQLMPEFLSVLNLYRNKELNSNKEEKGMFDDNGRVRAQKLRGEKSEGFWIPISTVNKAFPRWIDEETTDATNMEFDHIGTTKICQKYVSKATKKAQGSQKSSKKIANEMFHQHFDTAQYGRNSYAIGTQETMILTEKLHGTSQRAGNVKVKKKMRFNIWKTFLAWCADGVWMSEIETEEWQDMIGTRRVILDEKKLKEDSGFHSSNFRQKAAEPLIGNMKKGETFYYEVVGYEHKGRPIMGSHGNEKLKPHLDEDEYTKFIETFGDTTTFSYGCEDGELDIYVYRITLTNEDGYSVDLSWEAVKDRCHELGIKTVPELYVGSRQQMAAIMMQGKLSEIDLNEMAQKMSGEEAESFITNLSDQFIKQISEGKTTVGHNLREGLCVRVEKGLTPLVLKEKNFQFKVLEGIIKDSGVVDTEEAEG